MLLATKGTGQAGMRLESIWDLGQRTRLRTACHICLSLLIQLQWRDLIWWSVPPALYVSDFTLFSKQCPALSFLPDQTVRRWRKKRCRSNAGTILPVCLSTGSIPQMTLWREVSITTLSLFLWELLSPCPCVQTQFEGIYPSSGLKSLKAILEKDSLLLNLIPTSMNRLLMIWARIRPRFEPKMSVYDNLGQQVNYLPPESPFLPLR